MPSARRGRKPKLQDRLLGRDKTLDHAGPCGSFAPVFGAIINAVAILVGGLFGVTNPNALSVGFQLRAKMFIGLCAFYVGLRMLWISVNGTAMQTAKQLIIAMAAMVLGSFVGRLLRLQEASNSIGRYSSNILQGKAGSSGGFSDGFVACSLVLCANPLGIVGSLLGGVLEAHPLFRHSPLLVKAMMDALAAASLAGIFRWGVIGSFLPVLAWQGTLALLAGTALPWLRDNNLIDSVGATGGIFIAVAALVIFEIKKVELASFIPGLFLAPVFTWWLK